MVRGRELAVLRRDHEGLGNEVEVFGYLGMLQPLDVLVQPVLPRQLVRSGNRVTENRLKVTSEENFSLLIYFY